MVKQEAKSYDFVEILVDNLTYAVFDIDAMPAQPVFQHEIGHLFEGRHPDDANPGDMHAHQ